MANHETWATLFELLIDFEREMADFYRALVKKFSHVPKAARFWGEMLTDEIQHIQVAMNIRDSLTPSQLLDPADPSLLRKLRKALRPLGKDNLNSVRTLEDAYQLAHQLESCEVSVVLNLLVIEFIGVDKHKRFAVWQSHHVDKLADFFQTFGAEWRKSIVIRDTKSTSDQ